MRAAMVRAWLLFVALAALMGLLAPIARLLGSADATLYSALFSCLELGAVFSAFALHRLRARGMAIFLMAVMSGSAVGAAMFGVLAGVREALAALALSTGAAQWWLRARLNITAD